MTDETVDQDVEAYTASITMGQPVWIEAPDRLSWLAHDPLSGLQLRLALRTAGRFRRPRWMAYVTRRDGATATPVLCDPNINVAIHIAENLAARGKYTFPPTTEETT
jgi:hypothetical protein